MARPNNRTAAVELRDVKMMQLEAQGYSRTQIAVLLDIHKSTVTRGIERALAEVKSEAADVLRTYSGERLRAVLQRCFVELDKPHPIIRDGQRYDDVTDVAAVVALLRTVLVADASLRRLHGLDAPTRARLEIKDESDVDRDIERLVAELAARAEDGAPVPTED